MDRDERLRRAVAAFGSGCVWEMIDAALASVGRDELRARRDGIVERLYAGGRCRNCGVTSPSPPPPPPPQRGAAVAGEEYEAVVSPEAEGGAGEPDVEIKITAIRDFLEDPDQVLLKEAIFSQPLPRITPKAQLFNTGCTFPFALSQTEDELLSLLQNLADMDITYKALQETDIGRQVNGLRKHPSGEVRLLVKQLIRKWKEIVDDWVRLHNSSGDGGSSIITDGDSPDKVQYKIYQGTQVSEFKYSPSPNKPYDSSSERVNDGIASAVATKRRPSPVPVPYNARQINNTHHSTTSSSAPAMMKEQKDSPLDLDRLDSARKRLQENYQEAQNAKKQRTIQVMDITDIPKPKNRTGFIHKGIGGGFPAKHR
ncbi:hypothetical protein GUJ93_ZPchr0011g27248 [Zizania palustris]|uniref:TFIIS N-terminal domain-containing protein n=1 Tax=Zizania palustris TaxID=103762 RepID=A0A8J5WDG1_ZIZPA|nr:hypothetical protein GUJ93_ZPchr0011g27248 [Zizania palustris]